MGDECCFLLCLISKKRQVFGVHVMIEAPVNTCSQKINVKFFPTPSSSIKRKKTLNADHEKREAEVISPYLYISVSKGCVIMLKKNYWDGWTWSATIPQPGWSHTFMFFTPDSDPTVQISRQNSRLTRPGNFSSVLYCLILVKSCEL